MLQREPRQHLFHRRHWIGRSTQPTLRWKSCISSFIRRDGAGRWGTAGRAKRWCEHVWNVCLGQSGSNTVRSPIQMFTFQDMPEISRNEVENGSKLVPRCSNLRIWSAWNQSRFHRFHRDPHATNARRSFTRIRRSFLGVEPGMGGEIDGEEIWQRIVRLIWMDDKNW